jgi:peptide deformylase
MPNPLKIITNPNPILRKKSVEINEKDISSQKIKELYLDMEEIMLKGDGIGLAAPQVGKNIRLCVINASTLPASRFLSENRIKEGTICMINPKITKKSWAREWGEEGCLSVPNVFGQVRRHKKITCQYFDLNGQKIKLNADGLLARVIQHEIDHLDGILFIDKARDVKEITK